MGCNTTVAGGDMSIYLNAQQKDQYYRRYCNQAHVNPLKYIDDKQFIVEKLFFNKQLLQKYSRICRSCLEGLRKPVGYHLEGFSTCKECFTTGVIFDNLIRAFCSECNQREDCYSLMLCDVCKGLGLKMPQNPYVST